jgi:fatty-acid desaturase
MRRGDTVKIYNVTGYLIVFLYTLACMYSAPAHLGPWTGLLIGAAYFLFCWFFGGLYLADILHLGIAHRSLDYKDWFIKAVTVVNNAFAIYVNPITWVNRHRLHHKNSDHDGDPNKVSGDGFLADLISLSLAVPVPRRSGRRRYTQVANLPCGSQPGVYSRCANSHFLPYVAVRRKSEIYPGDVDWSEDFLAGGST